MSRLRGQGGMPAPGRGNPVAGVCLLLALACAVLGLGGERRAGAATLEADIVLAAGPSAGGARFQLRGSTLSLSLLAADDGALAGQFRLTLARRDPLFSALADLPATVSGPPPRPGMPVVSVTVRGLAGKPGERRLVVARPTSDPAVSKLLTELGRCEQKARTHPTMALALDMLAAAGAYRPGQPQTVTVRLVGKGMAGAHLRVNPGLVSLQVAEAPAPPTPGVPPLPPTWEPASEPVVASPRELKAGATIELPLVVSQPSRKPRMARAVLDGNLTFQIGGTTQELRMSLSSKAQPLPGVAPPAKKP